MGDVWEMRVSVWEMDVSVWEMDVSVWEMCVVCEGKEEDHRKTTVAEKHVVAHFSARFPELPVCSLVGVVVAIAVIATGRGGGREGER